MNKNYRLNTKNIRRDDIVAVYGSKMFGNGEQAQVLSLAELNCIVADIAKPHIFDVVEYSDIEKVDQVFPIGMRDQSNKGNM